MRCAGGQHQFEQSTGGFGHPAMVQVEGVQKDRLLAYVERNDSRSGIISSLETITPSL